MSRLLCLAALACVIAGCHDNKTPPATTTAPATTSVAATATAPATMPSTATAPAEPTVTTGTLGQSLIMVAAPVKWNGDLLILAHGYRPDREPLRADFDAGSPLYKGLLRDGWLVAATSYRRNGSIIREACEDIDLLRAHVEKQHGKAKRVFVLGGSMGGAIVTLLAETRGQQYNGVVAVGAALHMRDAQSPHAWTYNPQMPLLFVTNQSETAQPADYVSRAKTPTTLPAHWLIKRDGHCNVRDVESRAALDALVAWSQTGKIVREKDATIVPADLPSVATFKDGRAYVKITKVTVPSGSIYTPLVLADLQRLGITPGTRFTVGMGDKSFIVRFGKTYWDVPEGQWVSFLQAEGCLQISRNNANAASELGCKTGDEIYISK